jgi:RNA polymerase sigma-54 factor
MTPQLQQAIKLLQMSNLELQGFVESELERNPLLERDDRREPGQDSAPAEAAESENAEKAKNDEGIPEIGSAGRGATPGPTDSGWASMRPSRGGSLDADTEFGATLTREKTLSEHLTEQLALSGVDAADRLVAQHLIGMINEAGYVAGELVNVAETLGTSNAHVEEVLAVMQGFDPPGICARDLKDCLAIQLRDRNRLDPAMSTLLDNLALVAKRDFDQLRQLCKVEADDLREMVGELRSLNPKPGHVFGSEPIHPVVPDVFVRNAPDGTWMVELNSETLPRVLVNNQYLAQVTRGASNADDKTYLSECHSNATWLVRSLDQRAKTILKVAREIVRQQDAFLVKGVQHLRPLNLKTVADAISMHESTVSRVTSNKYMATPRGAFELKYFFTTAIGSAEGGEAHSSESVRHRIRELIEALASGNILSDDTIVEMLKAGGVEIARRTVAKYRESLNIPSSVQRRREKKVFG